MYGAYALEITFSCVCIFGEYKVQTKRSDKYIPISSWADKHDWPCPTELRRLVTFRKQNGLEEYGVVKKIGHRTLINEDAFYRWMEGQKDDSQ